LALLRQLLLYRNVHSSAASHFRSSPFNSFHVSPNSVAKSLSFIVLLNFFMQLNKTPLTTENTLLTFALTIVFIETAKGHYRRSRSSFRNTILFLNSIYLSICFHLLVCIIFKLFICFLSLLPLLSLQHSVCYSTMKVSAMANFAF